MQADNRCADSAEFIFYCFNMRARLAAIQGTSTLWKCSPQKMKILEELLKEPHFLDNLEKAAKSFEKNPTAPMTDNAKDIMLKILPLMVAAGKKVPYGNCGNSELALCQMIACRRFFGNFTYFFTLNPVIQDYGLALRIACPLLNNSDMTGKNNKILSELQTHSSRSAMLDTHPIGASLMYLRLHSAVWNYLMRFPYPEPGSHVKGTPAPASCRKQRGFLGHISSYFTAHETSQAGAQHSHSQIHGSMYWSLLKAIAANEDLNKIFGDYISSIVTTQIPYGPEPIGWTQSEKKYEPFILDGKDIHIDSDEFKQFLHHGLTHKQNHEFHNFSCFKNCKNDTDKCRFGFPISTFNHRSGIYQIKVIRIRGEKESSIGIMSHVDNELPQADSFVEDDERNLFVILSRRSSNTDVTTYSVCSYAEFYENNMNDKNIPFPTDLHCRNQWFVDCSGTVSAATNFAQNNLQISDAGAGIYLCKYIAKGDGTKLTHSLPMIFEAIKISSERPSVAADALINPLRAAMRALSRIINNQSRSSEYSVRLCLSHLLGMRQFECSHAFKFVYAHALHLYLLEQNEAEQNEAEQNAVDQSDPIENILHEDWTIDANAEYSHGSLEVKDGRIFMISQAIDYRYRPLEFKDHSPLEYFITTIKVKKSESESKSISRQRQESSELYDADVPAHDDSAANDAHPLLPLPSSSFFFFFFSFSWSSKD